MCLTVCCVPLRRRTSPQTSTTAGRVTTPVRQGSSACAAPAPAPPHQHCVHRRRPTDLRQRPLRLPDVPTSRACECETCLDQSTPQCCQLALSAAAAPKHSSCCHPPSMLALDCVLWALRAALNIQRVTHRHTSLPPACSMALPLLVQVIECTCRMTVTPTALNTSNGCDPEGRPCGGAGSGVSTLARSAPLRDSRPFPEKPSALATQPAPVRPSHIALLHLGDCAIRPAATDELQPTRLLPSLLELAAGQRVHSVPYRAATCAMWWACREGTHPVAVLSNSSHSACHQPMVLSMELC